MNEALANLYARTGDDRYLKLAERFNHMAVLGPASERRDTLTGLHANTQIPKFIGTAREYELTGEEWLETASRFFWDTVVNERSYVIGGHSDGEMFSPKEKLSQALGPNTTETCNTYNMLKLTRHLFAWDPRAEYADYYERALYQPHPRFAEPRDRHDVLLRAPPLGVPEGLQRLRRRLLVLHRNGRREPRQVRRQHLFS